MSNEIDVSKLGKVITFRRVGGGNIGHVNEKTNIYFPRELLVLLDAYKQAGFQFIGEHAELLLNIRSIATIAGKSVDEVRN